VRRANFFNNLRLQRFASEKGNIINSFGKSRFSNRDQFSPGCSYISIQVLSGALLSHPPSVASLDQPSRSFTMKHLAIAPELPFEAPVSDERNFQQAQPKNVTPHSAPPMFDRVEGQ
jgi:hypothetical protein